MAEAMRNGYDDPAIGLAVTGAAARIDAILAMKASPDHKLKAFDALWQDSRHLDRVALREVCFLKLLKVMA